MKKGPTPQKQKEGVGTPSFWNFTSVGVDYNDDAEATVKLHRVSGWRQKTKPLFPAALREIEPGAVERI
jgi:hypothetical protein